MMQKTRLYKVLLLIGLMFFKISLLAQISASLEPYFDSYTKFVTSNERDRPVLYYQYDRIVRDTARLKSSLNATFSPRTFSQFQFLIVGGYGTNTPVRSNVNGEGSDLDLNMLFKINNGIKADISAYSFKNQVKIWLTSVFPNTPRSHYTFTIKDPVVEIKADTTFSDSTRLEYHMDLGSFNRLNSPANPNCLPNKLCSEMAWGTDLTPSAWNETASPSFAGDFNLKFPVNTTAGDNALSVCKMLKYWNKSANKDLNPDNIPPSLVYLIVNYNWIPTWSPPATYRLQQLIADVDSLRKNVFNNNCASVAGANLNVPFYTSMDSNVLNKMSPAALQKFCNSLKTLSDTLHFVEKQTNLQRALLALSNVFPQFNNVPPGTYRITSFYSSKVIYPKNSGTAVGDTIVQFTTGNEPIKKWILGNIEATAEGKFYYVFTNSQSKYSLINSGSSTTSGTPMVQGVFNNGDNQKWEIAFLGYDGNNKKIYQITNKKSNMVLDIDNPTSDNNARIIQKSPNGGATQKWYFEE